MGKKLGKYLVVSDIFRTFVISNRKGKSQPELFHLII